MSRPVRRISPPSRLQRAVQGLPKAGRRRSSARAVTGVRQTAERKAALIKLLEEWKWPNLSEACRQIGVARSTLYQWQTADPSFAEELAKVIQAAVDHIEETAARLATGEFSEPIASAGQIVGKKQLYSERMLELLLRAHRPDRYQEERRLLIKHEGQVLQQVLATFEAALDYAGITEAQRMRIAEYVRQPNAPARLLPAASD